jgi:hypothetical protein
LVLLWHAVAALPLPVGLTLLGTLIPSVPSLPALLSLAAIAHVLALLFLPVALARLATAAAIGFLVALTLVTAIRFASIVHRCASLRKEFEFLIPNATSGIVNDVFQRNVNCM